MPDAKAHPKPDTPHVESISVAREPVGEVHEPASAEARTDHVNFAFDVPLAGRQPAYASSPRSARHTKGWNLVTIAVVLFVLLGAAGGAVFMYLRHADRQLAAKDTWEIRNKAALLTLKVEAESLVREKQYELAFAKYEAIANMLVGQALTDPEVIALAEQIRSARYQLADIIGDIRKEEVRRNASTRRAPSTRVIAPPATGPATQPAIVAADPVTRPATVTADPATRPAPAGIVQTQPATNPAVETSPASRPTIATTSPSTAPVTIALAPTTSPATRPASPRSEAEQLRLKFDLFLQQGTNALAAGEPQAGLEQFLDARMVFDRCCRAKVMTIGSAEQIAMLHGTAIAYQLLTKHDKAAALFGGGTFLDQACMSKSASRQLLITRGTVDVIHSQHVMRTVVRLSNYLKDHPDELDSEILDVLFSAIVKAEDRTNRGVLAPHMKLYEDFNARLETGRPNERRWGIQWIPQVEFNTKMLARQAAMNAWYDACDETDRCVRDVRSLLAKLEAAKRSFRTSPATIAAGERAVETAKARAYAADEVAAKARAAIPPVPVLTEADYKRLLLPREVSIARSGPTGATAVASATDSRVIKADQFNLGGSDPVSRKTVAKVATPAERTTTGAATTAGAATDTGYTPPTAAPVHRRTFSRICAGFAIGPDLILASAPTLSGARRVTIEFQDAQPTDATVLRADDQLALIRIPGQKFAYANLASGFNGGAVQCRGFPDVSLFGIRVETLRGTSSADKDKPMLALARHPRLPGAPVLDMMGTLVGMEMADRGDAPDKLPMIGLDKIRAFLGADAPAQPCGNPDSAPVVQITSTFER